MPCSACISLHQLHLLAQTFKYTFSSWHAAAAGDRYVTFDGIARACAKAAGAPVPELIHYNAKDFDFGKDKPFPLRDQHFFTSIDKVRGMRG